MDAKVTDMWQTKSCFIIKNFTCCEFFAEQEDSKCEFPTCLLPENFPATSPVVHCSYLLIEQRPVYGRDDGLIKFYNAAHLSRFTITNLLLYEGQMWVSKDLDGCWMDRPVCLYIIPIINFHTLSASSAGRVLDPLEDLLLEKNIG